MYQLKVTIPLNGFLEIAVKHKAEKVMRMLMCALCHASFVHCKKDTGLTQGDNWISNMTTKMFFCNASCYELFVLLKKTDRLYEQMDNSTNFVLDRTLELLPNVNEFLAKKHKELEEDFDRYVTRKLEEEPWIKA